MRITIDNVLNDRDKTRYWLAKQTNLTYPTIKKLCDNNTTSIKFSMIQDICNALSCSPNDIFFIEESD